jgi:hypothetical protein
MREWMYNSFILDSGVSWRQVVDFTLSPLSHRGKSHRWLGHRAGLDDIEKRKFLIEGFEFDPLGRPACSQSLYRISCDPIFGYKAGVVWR